MPDKEAAAPTAETPNNGLRRSSRIKALAKPTQNQKQTPIKRRRGTGSTGKTEGKDKKRSKKRAADTEGQADEEGDVPAAKKAKPESKTGAKPASRASAKPPSRAAGKKNAATAEETIPEDVAGEAAEAAAKDT